MYANWVFLYERLPYATSVWIAENDAFIHAVPLSALYIYFGLMCIRKSNSFVFRFSIFGHSIHNIALDSMEKPKSPGPCFNLFVVIAYYARWFCGPYNSLSISPFSCSDTFCVFLFFFTFCIWLLCVCAFLGILSLACRHMHLKWMDSFFSLRWSLLLFCIFKWTWQRAKYFGSSLCVIFCFWQIHEKRR